MIQFLSIVLKSETVTTPYELTKTIRFRLEPLDAEYAKKLKETLGQEGGIDVLSQQCQKISNDFADLFLYHADDEIFHTEEKTGRRSVSNISFKLKRKVKYSWLRSYTKNSFYDWKQEKGDKEKKEKEYEPSDIKYLNAEFCRWLNEWEERVAHLRNLLCRPEESQKRRRDFASIIRGLLKWENFEFIKEFALSIKQTQIPEIDEKIDSFRRYISETEENLKKCEKYYLSSQSAGILVTKATLNYYTLNKTPKVYAGLKEEEMKKLQKKVKDYTFSDKKSGKRKQKFTFSDKLNFAKDENPNEWTLDEAYIKIKAWKAEQKSKFIEDVSGDKIHINNFREKYPLFDTIDDEFNKYCRLTKKIQDLADRINNGEKDLDTEIKEKRQERGKFFNAPGNKDGGVKNVVTENYNQLCEVYKKIALERGLINAKIKGLDAEMLSARRTEYWALIMQVNADRYLILIPRTGDDNHKKAKEYIDNLGNFKTKQTECTLYHFKSLTFRALWKLCFKGEDNTFFPSIINELKLMNKMQEQKKGLQHKQPPSFYQKVLKTEVAKKQLCLVDFGGLPEVLNRDYGEDIDLFISDMEKTCYVKTPLSFSVEQKDKFIKDFNAKVFKITSQDLRIASSQDGENGEILNQKPHTKIWTDFWTDTNETNKYAVRLNPEMGISYREADIDMKRKITSRDFVAPKYLTEYRNRYADEQFTLATTITLNAAEKKSNLQLKTSEDIVAYIDEFNQIFNKEFKGQWHYGIDRGIKELATLCIMKPSLAKYEIGGKQWNEPEFAKIEVWEMKDQKAVAKDDKGRERVVCKNISYFVNQEDLFKKKTVSCIDLTKAKLIGGKIFLDGDKETYLRLKELSVKRRIFELFSRGEIKSDCEILIKPSTLRIPGRNGEGCQIYWFTEEQKKSKEVKNSVKEMVETYLKELSTTNRLEDILTVEKINNLRDAITANMVGIIAHLQQTFPGQIKLENMKQEEHVEKQFQQSNENISRRLEWALYRKFQTLGLVPPQIKQSVILRDFIAGKQFGIIKFVKIGNSSQTCPRCRTKGNSGEKRKNKFVCTNKSCEFDSCHEEKRFEFKPLDNSDKVAAYIIASDDKT
jgi:hypothetical protein